MSKIIPQDLLSEYEILDTPPEEDFDDYTRLASQICGTPVSLITFLDEGRQWFKSRLGVEIEETPIEYSFCAHAVKKGSLLEVDNALDDERFRENPFVAGEPSVKFYAGVPLINPEGLAIGSLCVIDLEPRSLTVEQRGSLITLGRQLSRLLELRRTAHLLRKSREREMETNRSLEKMVEVRTAQLRKSEERFLQLAENSNDVFWFFELAPEKLLYVSPSVERLWGISASRCHEEPRLWMEAVHPEDKTKVVRALADAAQEKVTGLECEYRIVRPDGSIRWVLYRGTVIRDASSAAIRVGGIAKDVTERKASEHKLKLTLQRLQLAAKVSSVGIWDLNLETDELEWDEEMYELYGMTEDTVPGYRRWYESLHPEDREHAVAWVEGLVLSDSPVTTEFRIIRRNDGAVRYIRATAALLKDETGTRKRLIGTNWDSTEDRQKELMLEEALEQQKKLTQAAQAGDLAKREFLAAMSHEIRTPLNGMLGFAEIISAVDGLPDEARQYLETIASSGQALLRIINDVLDFSRLEAGMLMVEKKPFQPRELLKDIELFFSPQALLSELTIDMVTENEVSVTVLGDEGRIRQILLNLVGNALKFTRTGGIKVGVRRRGESSLEFSVEDTGPGIPPEKLDYIFLPFTQADSSNARKHGGTGLGLAISTKLAGLMGGSLTGENLMVGARFVLVVPVEVAQEAANRTTTPGSRSVDARIGLRKILVAEDDRVNLRLMLNILRSMGHEPVTAVNGSEAVSAFLNDSPDCIVMDVQMPELDGIEATKEIRRIEREKGFAPAFIMALTADVMPENREHCLNAGMNIYLNKPIKRQDIADAMQMAAAFRNAGSNGEEAA